MFILSVELVVKRAETLRVVVLSMEWPIDSNSDFAIGIGGSVSDIAYLIGVLSI